jgi:hypothetical protein
VYWVGEPRFQVRYCDRWQWLAGGLALSSEPVRWFFCPPQVWVLLSNLRINPRAANWHAVCTTFDPIADTQAVPNNSLLKCLLCIGLNELPDMKFGGSFFDSGELADWLAVERALCSLFQFGWCCPLR